MKTTGKRCQNKVRSAIAVGLLTIVAFALGLTLQAPAQEQSRFGQTPPRQQFLSGGERSELVLREISATLKQIEAHLERIEQNTLDATQALQSRRDNR